MAHQDPPFEADAATERVLEALAEQLTPAARVGVLTGAGISAASGIPTFRGADGYWKNHRAEDLATPEGFSRDPAVGWEWYRWRRDRIREASPNPAHDALSALAQLVAHLTILTQNVDGLHALSLERAGMAGRVEVVELHGNIWRTRCFRCAEEFEDRRPAAEDAPPPHCTCGGLLRPGVVWFGESLPARALVRAEQTATDCDVFLVVGTSAVVQPAASFAAVAARSGAVVAEFNLEATDLSARLDHLVHAPCERSLPALVERVRARWAEEKA